MSDDVKLNSDDVKLNLTKLGVIIAALAGIAGLAGAWFILPYRMDAAEKKQENFEVRVDRRFESTDAEARAQREILIRIDENVKQLKESRRD